MGDIIETLYGSAVVIEVLDAGLRVRVFKSYGLKDLGMEFIVENKE